jgi:NADPH:quinone reductase-like Zn-dependent oxidoreductase
MKAVIYEQNGGFEELKVRDMPDPGFGPGQAVVKVHAAALNHLDIWIRRGRPGVEMAFPHIPGSDAAGTVAAVGEGVEGVAPGDTVVLNPGLWCGHCEACLRGENSECPTFGIVGMACPGTFAEYVVVPAENLAAAPAHLSDEEAAALPLAGLTAWRMLMTRARLRCGERVLIHGIGGGVALAALQLAKLVGAEVIVTSSSDEKLAKAKGLGADHRVNYASADVVAFVKEVTGGRGVDVIIDTVGAATWPLNFQAVRKGGRVVHCGVTGGRDARVNLSALYWNQVSVMGSTMGSREEFRQLLQAVAAARLRPVIDRVHPLHEVREATTRMEEGNQFGKIVLKP